MKNYQNRLKQIDSNFLSKNAQQVTDDDIKKVTQKAQAIENKFKNHGPLYHFWHDSKLMLSMVKDYYTGSYRQIPVLALGAIVFTLLYVFSPIDIIPDFIPFFGLLDDALVVALCLKMVSTDLNNYIIWKKQGEVKRLN